NPEARHDRLGTVVSGPDGGVGTPGQWSPSPPTSDTEVFVAEIIGDYVIEETATDANNVKATCQMHVKVINTGLHAQLDWSSLGDVDLHLLKGTQTSWFSSNDTYYSNKSTSWGALLDHDDIDGYGPENIRLAVPVAGEIYTIGVHAYTNVAASIATVRVYCGMSTMPKVIYTSRPLYGVNGVGACSQNEFWKVATVVFDANGACTVTYLNQYSTSAERCATF
ncbi:MAG: hypothetical protein AAB467_04900, partial [Patescibacteria group bacterium]